MEKKYLRKKFKYSIETCSKRMESKNRMLIRAKPDVVSLKEYEKELEEYSKINLKYFELKAKIKKYGGKC